MFFILVLNNNVNLLMDNLNFIDCICEDVDYSYMYDYIQNEIRRNFSNRFLKVYIFWQLQLYCVIIYMYMYRIVSLKLGICLQCYRRGYVNIIQVYLVILSIYKYNDCSKINKLRMR